LWPISKKARRKRFWTRTWLGHKNIDSAGNAALPFCKGLYETGYLEGRNVAIELRSTEQYWEDFKKLSGAQWHSDHSGSAPVTPARTPEEPNEAAIKQWRSMVERCNSTVGSR